MWITCSVKVKKKKKDTILTLAVPWCSHGNTSLVPHLQLRSTRLTCLTSGGWSQGQVTLIFCVCRTYWLIMSSARSFGCSLFVAILNFFDSSCTVSPKIEDMYSHMYSHKKQSSHQRRWWSSANFSQHTAGLIFCSSVFWPMAALYLGSQCYL